MKHELSTKLYKLDFKDLINNATNKEYWTKKWEIYNYDGMTIEFSLESINITNNKLSGLIRLNGGDGWSNPSAYITIPLQEENFLKLALERELVGKVDYLFLRQGENDLRKTREYRDLEELESDFNDKLRGIAEDFLDSNNVYNDTIRDVYIDDYVSNNEKDYTSDYLDKNKYNTYVPHRTTFAYIMGFSDKAESIIEDSSDIDLDWIFEEAEELRLKLEEDNMEEFEENLEDI